MTTGQLYSNFYSNFWRSKMKKNKFTVLELFILFSKPQRLGANRKMFGLRTNFSTKLCQDLSKHRTTQHGGREGEQEQVTMC